MVLWEAFAIVYYGFPFPNTAYAKLFETGVGQTERALHGMYYFQNVMRSDPVTALAIGSGIAAGLASRNRRQAAVAGGILAYLVYVLLIGGDFVTGRFLSAAVLGAGVLLSRWQPLSRAALALATAVVVAVGLSWNDPPPLRTAAVESRGEKLMDPHGIADERSYYYPYSGFLRVIHGASVASHPWSLEGLEARREHVRVTFRGDIGFFGFYAGPDVHVVDVWGLADPLMARLPARTDVSWRVGHFTRAIPAGYEETLLSGRNEIADPQIAALYDRIALVTRASLFSSRRLAEIWRMNVSGGGAHE
jgi:arabinofuranosyltransferase